MLFELAYTIVFISLTITSLATEIHIQAGCIEIIVGSAADAKSDTSCACVPDNDFWHISRCRYKDYSTGWLTTKVTILDPPCEEAFEFPTRYQKVTYTVDGCLRDWTHKAIHCCPQRPYQFPFTRADLGDNPFSADAIATGQEPSLDPMALLGDEASFHTELPLNDNMALDDFNSPEEHAGSPDGAMAEVVGLTLPFTKRGDQPYRIKRKPGFFGR